ncbi:MAG: hypothetical protein JSS27_05380 [Planctomycetes bacterium]|nr:hypothetical protein [Planctomycetota bacterium]
MQPTKRISNSMILIALTAMMGAGCSVTTVNTEQRVVEMSTLDANEINKVGESILQEWQSGGILTELHSQFPSVDRLKLEKVYLRWHAGIVGGKFKTFFLTGIEYDGDLPEGKGIADQCEVKLREALNKRGLATKHD